MFRGDPPPARPGRASCPAGCPHHPQGLPCEGDTLLPHSPSTHGLKDPPDPAREFQREAPGLAGPNSFQLRYFSQDEGYSQHIFMMMSKISHSCGGETRTRG